MTEIIHKSYERFVRNYAQILNLEKSSDIIKRFSVEKSVKFPTFKDKLTCLGQFFNFFVKSSKVEKTKFRKFNKILFNPISNKSHKLLVVHLEEVGRFYFFQIICNLVK